MENATAPTAAGTLIATGVVLFVFILLINLCFSVLKGGKDHA